MGRGRDVSMKRNWQGRVNRYGMVAMQTTHVA